MEENKITKFFKVLEEYEKDIISNNLNNFHKDIVIVVILNEDNKYNIYYGIKNETSEIKYCNFDNVQNFLETCEGIFEKKAIYCIENVSEIELNKILFAFSTKFLPKVQNKSLSNVPSFTEFLVDDINELIKYFNSLGNRSILIPRNIFNTEQLKTHIDGIKLMNFFLDSHKKLLNYELPQEIFYGSDYKENLKILEKLEESKIESSMKVAYIVAANEIIEKYIKKTQQRNLNEISNNKLVKR